MRYTAPDISTATDEDRTIATITLAFGTDPVVRWFMPDPRQYLSFWPPFVKAFVGPGFACGSVFAVDDYGGVAMWLPPGVGSDEDAIGVVLDASMPEARMGEVNELFEQMDEFHPTSEHWYLPLIGVDAPSQNRGHGSALLCHVLDRCDSEGVPAYLEATTHRNQALYARHGFEVMGVIQVGESPPVWPMYRTPH